jgi:hypothetical protein
MTNHDWQRVSQVLGILLVILVAGAAFVVFTRPSGSSPGATPSPTRIAVASPSGSSLPTGSRAPSASASPGASPSVSAEPSPSESIEPSASPSLSPSPELSPSPSPSESPSPSPSPTIGPTAPTVSIRFLDVGFDTEAATTKTARSITFKSEGPGQVAVHLAHVSEGHVQLCLQRGSSAPQCQESDKVDLLDSTDAPGKITWTVTGLGVGGGSPIGDLRLVFRSSKPAVTIDGFRFQGTQNTGYNGVEAEFDVAGGNVHADGHWDGAQRPWRTSLTDTATGASLFDGSGSGNDLLLDAGVSAGRVHISLTNTEDFSDQEVFLHAVIRWP